MARKCNAHEIRGDHVVLFASNSEHEIKVDLRDLDRLLCYTWHIERSRSNLYARTTITVGGKRIKVRMHRFLVKKTCEHVDHKNRDCLDNRRRNLRPASRSQNAANAVPRRNNKSGFRGVLWDNRCGKWYARITVRGRSIRLGSSHCAREMAEIYNRAAREHFGEFAVVNLL